MKDIPRPALSSPRILSAAVHLTAQSLRRQFFSRQTVVSFLLTAIACVVVLTWSLRPSRQGVEPRELSVRTYTERIVVPVHLSFLVPIFAISYGAASLAGEREDHTLVYLLVLPLPRPLVYSAKFLAAALLVIGWAMGSFGLLAAIGREPGREAFRLFCPAVLLGSFAYTSLFHALGAIFRRGTIVSLVYAFFLELLLGNMPGIAKRASISFYLSCLIYDRGAAQGVKPQADLALFLPVSGQTATIILGAAAVALFLLGLAVFSLGEYRDVD